MTDPKLQAKKVVSYEESDIGDDDDDVCAPSMKARKGRAAKRRRTDSEDEDDVFVADPAVESDADGEGACTVAMIVRRS